MKRVTFHPDVENEIMESVQFYESQCKELGHSFLEELESAIDWIISNPQAGSLVSKEIRRKPTKRFPDSVLYVVEPNCIRIVAIAHHKRRPNYWRSRMKDESI